MLIKSANESDRDKRETSYIHLAEVIIAISWNLNANNNSLQILETDKMITNVSRDNSAEIFCKKYVLLRKRGKLFNMSWAKLNEKKLVR